MVIEITFKMPGALQNALEQIPEEQREQAKRAAVKFIKYGEYITIELFTEAEKCEVKEIS
jgi:hypothetical protein